MDEARTKGLSRKFGLIAASAIFTILGIVAIYKWKGGHNSPPPPGLPGHENTASAKALNPFQIAVQKIEEERGKPTGNKAEINVPAELKLYKDKRRFLAIQVAEARKQDYEIPHDFSELASMIERGEFARLPTLGPDYILYGVGIKADDEFTHYDAKTGKSIPLFGSEADLEQEVGRLDSLLAEFDKQAQKLKRDLAQVKKEDRALREEILNQIADAQKSTVAAKIKKDLLNSFYQSKEHRQLMMDEYQKLAELARSFDGRSYDFNDSASRKEFKISLLSVLRPPAFTQLEEIARAYQEKFGRPLPVTSLARTIEYQRFLGEAGNPNATQIEVPPHTTGLAFDIYTYYMAADEQQFLMDEIARLKREGRVEALRENRNHIHVFAFTDMKPPNEQLIKESLNQKADGSAQ
jgi:hypothetical protein